MGKKRGQVTLFVILGILLVIAVLLVLIFNENVTLSQIIPAEIIPTRTGPVQQFVQDCIETVGFEGISLLGAQGGYIYLPREIESDPLAIIDTGVKVPLWQYGSQNRIPSIGLMESHLSRYINEELRSCLGGLIAFSNQYDIIEKGDISTEVTITDKIVDFAVEFPIDVLNKDGTIISELRNYQVDLPIKLKHMREVGQSIMETEALEMKFEKLTVDLLALDPDIPLVGSELSCSKKVWLVDEVEQKIKTLLRKNLPSVRADFTNYIDVPDDQPYILNHYVWRVTDLEYNDIRTGFTFAENPFRMNVGPRRGATLQSGELHGQDLASFLCFQQWKFVYDITYPVMVSVEDIENNVVLNFGFNVHINDNKGARQELGAVSSFSQVVVDSGTTEDYCVNVVGDHVMTVNTFDNVSDPLFGESYIPIDDVNITFTCLKHTCEIGRSQFESGGAESRLTAQFPYCPNGVLRAIKPGYKQAQKLVTPTVNGNVDLYLTPLKIIEEFSVVKHVEQNGILSAARALDTNERAFITIKYGDQPIIHESTSAFPLNQNFFVQPLELLSEADFEYDLEIFLMDDNRIVGGFDGKWKPLWADLQNADKIEFHVVTKDIESDGDMLELLSRLEEISQNLEPVLR